MKKIVLVGLGNPGPQYVSTRHNLGVAVLRHWVEEYKATTTQFKNWTVWDSVEIAELSFHDLAVPTQVTALFPLSFMNKSGEALKAFMDYEKLSPETLVLIHDDIELPLGEIRLAQGTSAKGHNGIRSIYQQLGTNEVKRLRLGVGRPIKGDEAIDEYVLHDFLPEEKSVVADLLKEGSKALSEMVIGSADLD